MDRRTMLSPLPSGEIAAVRPSGDFLRGALGCVLMLALVACNQPPQEKSASTAPPPAPPVTATAPPTTPPVKPAVAPAANPKEQAFLQAMVPHHEMAIKMAQTALDRAKDPQLKTLAQAIVSAQTQEIAQMHAIHQRLYSSDLKPDPIAHGVLGMSMKDAGMDMSTDALATADPFDKAFIDAMIPHHQGAIRMARVLLANTKDAELTKLGTGIITAQSAEIAAMNALRKKLYGAESPAGGVPAESK